MKSTIALAAAIPLLLVAMFAPVWMPGQTKLIPPQNRADFMKAQAKRFDDLDINHDGIVTDGERRAFYAKTVR